MQIGVALKGSYAIKLKIMLDNLMLDKVLALLMIDIKDKMILIMDVSNTGKIKFVPVDWILMLQMMLQLILYIKVDVLKLLILIMIWNVMLKANLGVNSFLHRLDLKMQFAPF